MGVIMGIIWFVTGMHWAFALGYLIMAIVADFVAGAGQYKSKKLNSLSYILFSLGGTGSYIVFFVDPNGWAQTMLGNGTEQSYIDTMQATANTGILIAMFATAIVASAISAFVGCKMLKKQFEKAGITACAVNATRKGFGSTHGPSSFLFLCVFYRPCLLLHLHINLSLLC